MRIAFPRRAPRALPLALLLALALLGAAAPSLHADEESTHVVGIDTDADLDVDATGALPRTLGGFAAKVEEGAIWVRESAPTRCLPGDLTGVVSEIAERFGAVRIMSTHRSVARNRRAGGAPRSMHLSCRAIDFRVAARKRSVLAFLREHTAVGGLKLYRNGLIHIDDGERRSW